MNIIVWHTSCLHRMVDRLKDSPPAAGPLGTKEVVATALTSLLFLLGVQTFSPISSFSLRKEVCVHLLNLRFPAFICFFFSTQIVVSK